MFNSARFKLTFWYVVIILLVNATISGLFFIRTRAVLEQEYLRIERRMQRQESGLPVGPGPMPQVRLDLLADDLELAQRLILMQLVIINVIILVIVATAAYILAGKTLAPLQRSHEAQQQFITDAAHELKTPLTAMKTSLEVALMDQGLNRDSIMVLKENLEEVNSLQQLTERLLQIAKNGHQPTPHRAVLINSVVQKAVKTIRPLAGEKQIKIVSKLTPTNPSIWGDEASLKELIAILLDNAVRYSPEQTQISVTTTASDDKVVLMVSDQGIGIPRQQLPRIFQRFYRVNQDRTNDDIHGYGLGLSIAKKIIIEHQATLAIKSKPGEGSTFTISFPRLSDQAALG